MTRITSLLILLALPLVTACSPANDDGADAVLEAVDVTLYRVDADGRGEALGTVLARNTDFGLLLEPDLEGLPQGIKGFHVHQNPDCGPAENDAGEVVPGLAAGGHYDPEDTGAHHGPYSHEGHLGDMPPLYFDADERATLPVLAPLLSVADLQGRALVLHAGGDNFSDDPEPLGGGGARAACGVVE